MVVATKLMHALDEGPRPAGIHPQAVPLTSSTPELEMGVLFQRVLDAIVVARLSTGTIVLWNAAAEKLFGYPAEEAIGQSIEMLMPEPIAQVHRAGMARYQRTGHGLIIDAEGSVEMPARKRSGEEIRVELSLSELRDSNGERYAVAAIRDATMRKQLELTTLELVQARVARSEAEAELAGRDELLATLTCSLENDPSSDDLELLVRTLNNFRQLHTGELRLRSVETDLVDIVHAAADDARRHMPRRRFLVHTPPLASVTCDPARMRQVLDQVLDEACRRTRDGSRIEIRLELISPHVIQLALRSDACGDARVAGPGLQLSRTLVQRQGGTFTTAISSGGSLEVVMTLPGSPHPPRRRPSRPRRPGRAAPSS
ncbi:MAG: PAS domain S-box protein [Chloroflexi bacterium]|nr:PAS domain S-box protein [Chloroflexota bacterium]